GDRGKKDVDVLPRRALVLIAALGWVVHAWPNYYAIAPLLLLPFYAKRHSAATSVASLGIAVSTLLPEFGGRLLIAHPAILLAKLVPYLAIPGWMVALELRSQPLPRIVPRLVAAGLLLSVVATGAEVWRQFEARHSERTGRERFDAGDPIAALGHFELWTRLAPLDGRAHMYRAMALDALGRKAESLTEFRKARDLAPDSPAAQDNYGRALFMRGDADAAAAQLEKARALAPYDTEIWLELAKIRLAQRRVAESETLLHRIRELDPTNQEAADLLGNVSSP